MTRYKFLHHNIGENTPKRADTIASEYLRETVPDVAVITEDRGQRDVLRRLGYRTRYQANGPGTRILVGVREDHRIVSTTSVVMTETWRGPKVATRRAPRVAPLVTWESRQGDLFDLFAVHFPYDGPDGVNARAWREMAEKLENRWDLRSARPRERHMTMMGDFNAGKATLRRRFRGMEDATVVEDNMAVDHLIVSGGLSLVRGRRLMDVPAHPPYLWTLETR